MLSAVLSIRFKSCLSITITISKRTFKPAKDLRTFIPRRNYGTSQSPSSNQWHTYRRITFHTGTWPQRIFLLLQDPTSCTSCSVSTGNNRLRQRTFRFCPRRCQPSIFLLMSFMNWKGNVWNLSIMPENLMCMQWECYCSKLQLLSRWQIVTTLNVLLWIPKFLKTNSNSLSTNTPKSLVNSCVRFYPTERPTDQTSLHSLKDSLITNVKIPYRKQLAQFNLSMQEYLLSKRFRSSHQFRRLSNSQRMFNRQWDKRMYLLNPSSKCNPKAWQSKRLLSIALMFRKFLSYTQCVQISLSLLFNNTLRHLVRQKYQLQQQTRSSKEFNKIQRNIRSTPLTTECHNTRAKYISRDAIRVRFQRITNLKLYTQWDILTTTIQLSLNAQLRRTKRTSVHITIRNLNLNKHRTKSRFKLQRFLISTLSQDLSQVWQWSLLIRIRVQWFLKRMWNRWSKSQKSHK